MLFETLLLSFGSVCESAVVPTMLIIVLNYKFWKTDPVMKLLTGFLLISFLQFCITFPNDIKTVITGKKYFNTLFLYNWHNVLTSFIIIAIYYKLLTVRFKEVLCISLCVIFAFFVILEFSNDSLSSFSTTKFNTYTYNVTNLMVLLLCLLYAYQILQNLEVEDITKYSYFWVNTGFLIYYAGSMFVYLYMLVANKQQAQIAWVINSVLLLTFYIAISLAYFFSKNLRQE